MSEVEMRGSESDVRGIVRDIVYSKLVQGGLLYLGAKMTDYASEKFIEKHIKQHGKLATGLGFGLASPFIERYSKWLAVPFDRAGEYGVMFEARLYLDKMPYMVFTDANTIEVFNLGTIAKVFKNGTELTANTDYTVSDNTISLSAPLEDGDKIVVVDSDGVAVFKKYKA